ELEYAKLPSLREARALRAELAADGIRAALFGARTLEGSSLEHGKSTLTAGGVATVAAIVNRHHVRVCADHADVADVVINEVLGEFGPLMCVAGPEVLAGILFADPRKRAHPADQIEILPAQEL